MGPYRRLLNELRQPTRQLRDAIPGAWQGFASLHREALAEGSIPARLKEVIALAIAVDDGCEGCIAYHARGAAQ